MSAAMSGKGLFGDQNMFRAMQTPWAPPVPPLSKPPNTGSVVLAPPFIVGGASGLGAGGGAAVGPGSDSSYGHILVYVGLAPGLTGGLGLQWPQFPAGSPLLWACDWATLSVTGTVTSIITWTALQPLVTSTTPLRIGWRWTVPV